MPEIELSSEADIEVATEVFTRLNTGGKSLSVFEIMVAKTYDDEREFDLSEKYEELCEELGDWEIPDSTILQLISILLTQQCSRKVILLLKRDAFIDIWDDAVDYIKTAIDFFKKDYRIPVSKLLPYDGLIVPFAYYFCEKSKKTKKKIVTPIGDDAKYLQDLFWRIAISERYSAALESRLVQDVRRVDTILKGKKPTYDWPIDTSPKRFLQDGEFRIGASFTKAILVIYAAKKPKCFRTGRDVTLDNNYLKQANSKNYHHFFPKKILKEADYDDFYINHILNITMIDDGLNKGIIGARLPSDYLSEFKKENPNLKKHLETHLIDLEKDKVLKNDYETFFENRAKRVSAELKKLIIEK